MSSTRNAKETPSSEFEALFNEALTKYTKKTGDNLRDHPLASKIDSCDTIESFLAIFQEQAHEFEEYRNGDSKLIEWLRPVVDGLLVLSKSGAVKTAADLVSPHKLRLALLCSSFRRRFPIGVPPCEICPFCDQRPSLSVFLSLIPVSSSKFREQLGGEVHEGKLRRPRRHL